MTAHEWLRRTFQASGGTFRPCNPGDFQRYPLPGIDPTEIPHNPPDADIDAFLAYFWSAIDSALASGGSIYAALTDATVQDRGWRPYFELWKAKGIID